MEKIEEREGNQRTSEREKKKSRERLQETEKSESKDLSESRSSKKISKTELSEKSVSFAFHGILEEKREKRIQLKQIDKKPKEK